MTMTLVNITMDEHEQGVILRAAARYPRGGPWTSLAEKITKAQDGSMFEVPVPDPENGIGVLRAEAMQVLAAEGIYPAQIKPSTAEDGHARLQAIRLLEGT
jgi:hypothetical protein